MAYYKQSDSPVFSRFFSPAFNLYNQSDKKYDCTNLTDLDYLEMGIQRCLSESQTGRDFIQRHGDHDRKKIDLGLHFKALRSERRLTNISSINSLLSSEVAQIASDPFQSISELDNFAIYAGDGHYHSGAVHDPKKLSSKGEMRKLPVGHFFMLNLRTHYLSHLGAADTSGTRKGEHDMHMIKRSETDALRGDEPKGRKVLLAWDKAGIDFAYWEKVKRSSGLYFISREKKNMNLICCGHLPFDRNDSRNSGVVSDEQVGSSAGAMLRRTTYVDPVEKTTYVFITTEMTLPPGILALLYKLRWDIEKVFDELKSKLVEKKAWASDSVAKAAQAEFLCITHNLMVIIEEMIRLEEGVENEAEIERKLTRKQKAIENGANYVAIAFQRITVRSLKFVRWLRNFAYRKVLWRDAIGRLEEIYATF